MTTLCTETTFTQMMTFDTSAVYFYSAEEVTIIKVDLDVDADYDNTVSVDNPDDQIEVSAGGIVCVGKRDELILRKVAPTTWGGDVLLTKNSTKIKVFDAATGGTEITFNGTDNKFPNSALPKTLYVQGENPSTALRDVTLTLTSDPGGCNDEVAYTVCKVESIEPDPMPNLIEINDGDGDPNTRVFLVPFSADPLSAPVTVRANILPSILSSSPVPVFSGLSINGNTCIGSLTKNLTRNTSKTVFTCYYGGAWSGLKTTVYVYYASVSLFADEGNLLDIDVGHSWGLYSIDGDTRLDLVNPDYWDYFQEIGFWPSIAGNGNCAGDVRLGAGAVGAHLPPSGQKEYFIHFSPLSLALPQVKALDDAPPWYNLFNYNCTDFAIGIGEIVNIPTMDAAGVSTPWAFSNWLDTN